MKCNVDEPSDYHAHTPDCQVLMLEDVDTNTTRKTKGILESEYPKFIMKIVKVIFNYYCY